MQKIKILIITLALAACFTSAYSQPAQTWKLLGVSAEGNVRTDAGLIIATSGLVVGDDLTGEKVQNALRSLWGLSLFSDIKIAIDQATDAGVFVVIQVSELPRLEFVDISGGKKVGKDELEKAIDLNKGQVLKPSDPTRLRRKIQDLCAKDGYLLADIEIKIKDGSQPNLKNLSVRVDEGTKVKIDGIYFAGNKAFSAKKLRGEMKNTHQKSLFRSGEFKRDKFQEDLDDLVAYYREHGYRDAEVAKDSSWYSDDRKKMYLEIFLEEGTQYYFGNVTFTGDTLFSQDELMNQLVYRPGEIYNQKKFDATMQDHLSSLYYDRGYIFAQIQPTITPRGSDTLDITYSIEPGNRFSVRQINITGNTKTFEKVIRREFSLKPGDTFDVSKLRRSIRDVTILNYFSDIKPDVEDVTTDQVDLYVKVDEKPTDQANVSAGYSQQDGLIGAIGFAAPNLFGTGQQLNLDWNFGQQYGSFSVGYTEPWLMDTETLVGVSLYSTKQRWVDGFTEYLLGGSLRLGRRFRWPDDYFRGDWTFSNERSRYYDFTDAFRASNTTGIIEGEVRYSRSITQVITRDSRDFPEFPTSGSVFGLTSELAGGPFGGNDKYHKHIVSVEWYTPVQPKVVLYNQFIYGYLNGLTGSSRDIPLLKYFYMGGSGLSIGTPLRGYDERTVGPAPVGGGTTAQGGKTELKVSSELRVQIVNNPTIYGLTFAEAGNTWLNFRQTDPFDLRRSVGVGVRLYMPLIGLIGLDYGFGYDYFNAAGRREGRWIPHFQFGRQF